MLLQRAPHSNGPSDDAHTGAGVEERERYYREQAEATFRVVQDASPDSFILLDVIPDDDDAMRDARIVYANTAA